MSTLARPPKQAPATRLGGRVQDGSATEAPNRAGRVSQLALVAPLLLFASGILGWVDSLAQPMAQPTTAAMTTRSSLDYAAGSLGATATVLLVGGVFALGWLALEVLRHPRCSERLSAVNLLVATSGVVTIALPLDLRPLGALLVLAGLAPLVRHTEAERRA